MSMPTLLELAETGAHFGHHRSLTYPKAKKFVFAVQKNVALINLESTLASLKQAQQLFQEATGANQRILFVGTRRSIRPIVKEIAESVGASYITERWFGGTLTNFRVIAATIKRMNELAHYLEDDSSKQIGKKERLREGAKLAHYQRFLAGAMNLNGLPELLVLASATEDKIAVGEAHQLGIPVIAITDTDTNPELVVCPIPANDDAPKAVELILRTIISKPESVVETKDKKTSKINASDKLISKEEPKTKTIKKTAKTTEPAEMKPKKVTKENE